MEYVSKAKAGMLLAASAFSAFFLALWLANVVVKSRVGGETGNVPALPLVVVPKLLDLGMLPPGGQTRGRVELYNPGPGPVQVAATRESCNCLSVHPSRLVIGPGERATIEVELDLAGDREARGALLLEVEGVLGLHGPVAYRIRAEARIRERASDNRERSANR